MLFSFFQNFDFLGRYWGKRSRNGPKWKKFCLSCFIRISGIIHHMIFIYGALMWHDISRNFKNFFKVLIFWVVNGVKGQKMAQNEKKLCLLHPISQEPYIIWSSFVVCKCKMIISFFLNFFKTLNFQVLGGSKGKKWPKMTKNSVCRALYLRNHTSYDLHLWYSCVIG